MLAAAVPVHAGREARCPIVAIGGSAGGFDAFKRFLGAVHADTGMAFVLIPHLDPRQRSSMVELLAKHSAIPVCKAGHRMAVRPNRAYVIPPNKNLAVRDGRLLLSALPTSRAFQRAVDFTLCSVAEDRQDAAVGIILSGAGSQGTLGVKEIKLAGGLVMAQDPATAECDEMPRNAIATGVVDHVLAPERMPEVLLRYSRRLQLADDDREPSGADVEALRRVLVLLQTRGNQDFRHYRKSMIMRRIHRRMALLQIEGLTDYVERLRDNADEITALSKDLLIGVTAFFRDPEAFAALAEHVVPALVERASADAPIRVWVPGCATGEEAYSIAILLLEGFTAAGKTPNIKIFATDIDEDSLDIARQGVYPDEVAAVLSRERLDRFFVKLDKHHYQVGKELCDSILFAHQNLITHAPFSRIDLISCRNILIYLEPDVKSKVISLLHFALNDGGYLLLGPSESLAAGLFEPISSKWRLYRRLGPVRPDLVTIPVAAAVTPRVPLATAPRRVRGGFAELLQKLLAEDFAPASCLINRAYEILALQGPLVNYLEFPSGEMTRDLLALARQGLRARIRGVCQRAAREGRTVSDPAARVFRNGDYVPCTVTARPIVEPKESAGLLIVVFEDRAGARPSETHEAVAGEFSLVRQLENEVRATREDLQMTIEELESSNEELKASNEEVMSMNEELQSTNEEIETSRQELQSLNEELAAVNRQLQDKVADLDKTSADLLNLVVATDIATIFLDTDLRIKRFTPAMAALLHLRPTDVGRPLRELAKRFEDDDLLREAKSVADDLISLEKEVRADDGRWFLRRILPYRAADGRVGGVVVTFVDVTQRVAAEVQARRLASVLRDSHDAIIVTDFEGNISGWNRGAERAYGYAEAQALKMNIRDLAPKGLEPNAAELARRLSRGEEVEAFETKRVARDGSVLDAWLTVTLLKDEAGQPMGIARTERDITARRVAEDEIRELNATLEQRIAERAASLRASEQRIRAVLDAAVDAIVTIDHLGVIETFNPAAERIFGYTAAEAVGHSVKMLMPAADANEHDRYLRRYRETREPRLIGRTAELRARRKDGTEFPIQLSVREIGHLGIFTGFVRDITEQKALQEEVVHIAALEQQRIGQELHDGTQQELIGLGLLAQSLSDELGAHSAGREAELAAKLAAGLANANRQVRALSRGLIHVTIEARRLPAALRDLAKSVADQHGLQCSFECPKRVEVADDVVATHLYRIAQEAVTNVVKHAQAEHVVVRLASGKRQLELRIDDDGIGIDERLDRKQGLGLRIMEHRCALIGGTLTIRRRADKGTAVVCTLPARSAS